MWSPTHVQVTVQKAKGLLTKGKNKTNDCFVTISLGKEKYQTSVKEKASRDVEWHEECELTIPEQGNTAEIVLTALHRNFLGVDEFLGTISIPLSSFDVYERPKNRWYTLCSKPGKENTKDRGELEVKIGFIVKAGGSLTDLTRKERHKSSLGQLSTAAQSIGGSLLSIGSIEKRKGLKKLAKSIGNRVKGKSKSRLDKDNLDEREEYAFKSTGQEPGEADPGVISEDEDEFTFDDLSHKSSASSLNTTVTSKTNNGVNTLTTSTLSSNNINIGGEPQPVPIPPSSIPPNKPPRFISSSNTSLTKVDNQEDEWERKLYGNKAVNVPKRWDAKQSPKIIIDEPKDSKPISRSPSPARFKLNSEPPSPAPRETIIVNHQQRDETKDERKEKKEEKFSCRSPFLSKKKKENKSHASDNRPSSERIIIGGEDAVKNGNTKSRLPHEILAQFEGKSREDLIELTLHLQSEIADKKKRLTDLEDYIDALLLRVIECSPRLLQNPFQGQRRLSSPGHQ